MVRITRRTLLRGVGTATVAGVWGTGSASAETTGEVHDEELRKLGHSLLSDPPGGYAEEDISPDGRYGVVGSYLGRGGTFLVDLRDLENPTEVHRLPSGPDTRNADVEFDPRHEVYYRTQETTGGSGQTGIEVVSYGYRKGTPTDPKVVQDLDNGSTHNVHAHPDAPVLYAVNEATDTPGLEIIDVSEPGEAAVVATAGPTGGNHDVVVDPDRDLLHAAYIFAGEFGGYMIFDISDPMDPTPVGAFDYTTAPPYQEVGEEGFDNCHYATYDPDRMLAYVGDEVGTGVPGGKHVFDIGWGEGSIQNPIPIGFTHSPHAERQEQPNEAFDWTTHNHSIVSRRDTTLMVSGDYHEGTVLYDVSDPRSPVGIDWYETDDGVAQAKPPFFPTGRPPMAWGANYSDEREFVFTSDMYTGVYTFRILPREDRPGRGPPDNRPGRDDHGDSGSPR